MDVEDGNGNRQQPTRAASIASFCLRRIAAVGAVRDFLRCILKSFVQVGHAVRNLFAFLYRFIVFHVRPFWIELSYFVLLALLGSLLMTVVRPRSAAAVSSVRYVDMLYMSTAAVTVSGLNSVDVEVFSESQILLLTLLMFVGGEVFVSFLNLIFRRLNNDAYAGVALADCKTPNIMHTTNGNAGNIDSVMDVTVRMASPGVGCDLEMQQQNHHQGFIDHVVVVSSRTPSMENILEMDGDLIRMKQRAVKYLGYVVLGYIVFFHVAGFMPVFLYYIFVPSAKRAIESKGLSTATFATTTIVSSFANGGIIPANESMGKFKANPGLLLMLIPQILGGNTLYPAFLRSVLWGLRKLMKPLIRSPELDLMIENPLEVEYPHLFPATDVLLQSLTSIGILSILVTLLATMNWNSGVLSGLTPFQKTVGVIFQSVNSRNSGEAIFDFSMIAPAVVVLFIFFMYLPAYTSFKWQEHGVEKKQRRPGKKKDHHKGNLASQLTYVLFFVVTACVLERKSISSDPANFSVLAVVFEIVSAYGNVGLSMGYSCARRLPTSGHGCVDGGYSFSGRWSDAGKLLVVLVMLFGRLKSYHIGGGKAWRLTPPNW